MQDLTNVAMYGWPGIHYVEFQSFENVPTSASQVIGLQTQPYYS